MKFTQLLAGLVLSFALAQAASADTIILFNETRNNRAFPESNRYLELGTWSDVINVTNANGGTASAAQHTNISTGFIGGTGSATATRPVGATEFASSTELFVYFTLFQQYTAHLDVDLFAEDGFTRARLANFETSELWNAFVRDGMTSLRHDLILMPGTYNFHLTAESQLFDAETSSTASFNGGLTLTPITGTEIPEPATMSLFALGLAAAGVRKRMLRRARP